jgi:hypothetical protein
MVTTDTASQTVTGTVTDKAGNTAVASVTVKVDSTKPTVAVTGVTSATYTVGSAPTPSCAASDALSGLSGACAVTGASNPGAVGAHTATATATDSAGNTTTVTASWSVVYMWSGWLQPVNDTAHQGAAASVFKIGSTVPLKFNLTDVNGAAVSAASAPLWLAPVQLGAVADPINDTGVTAAPDSGQTYRNNGGTWMYNWSTKGLSSGFYYRVGALLPDGTTHYVIIALR